MINVTTDTNGMLGNKESYGVSFLSSIKPNSKMKPRKFLIHFKTSTHGCDKADMNSPPPKYPEHIR